MTSKMDPKSMPNGTGGAQGAPRERPRGTSTRFGALREPPSVLKGGSQKCPKMTPNKIVKKRTWGGKKAPGGH